jgi:type VI secretion system protein ImpM
VAGFFGKIPSHGDFITRDLPRSFLDGWDAWLQSCIAQSKAQLGDGWLDVYLTSPIWRFGLSPGVCGPQATAGVLMPSVDRVGRYFPLTIATSQTGAVNPLQLPGVADRWFDAAEGIALRALDDDRFEANAMHDALKAIGDITVEAQRTEPAETMGAAWSLILVGSHAPTLAAAFAHTLAQRQAAAYSLWWTAGVETPAALLVAGLPEPSCFVDLLNGAQVPEAAPARSAEQEPAVGVALQ